MPPIHNSDAPPPGWVIRDARLEKDATVAGYLARGVEVQGRCYQADCRRWCVLDLRRLVERRLGAVPVDHLKPLFRCNLLGGCGLSFENRGGTELTLGMLRGRERVWVRMTCGGCQHFSMSPPSVLVAKLKADRSGDSGTRIVDLAGLAKTACRKCAAKRWAADVIWAQGGGHPRWLQLELQRRRM